MTSLYKNILIGLALTSVLFSGYFLSKFFEKDCYYGDVTGKIYCVSFLEQKDFGRFNKPLLTPPVLVGAYPDPKFTPGVVATTNWNELIRRVDGKTYSQRNRKTTASMKREVCENYKGQCEGVIEIDHFCPLAIGCADDVKNLWPQKEHLIVNGKDYGFKYKDKLEMQLYLMVKSKKMTPKEAQECILKDWIACADKYVKTPLFGSVDIQDPDDL